MRCGKGIQFARRAACTLAFFGLLSCGLLSAPAGAAPGDTLGVCAGSANPAGVAAFESGLGRTVARGHDYLDKRSWAAMLDISWLTQ